MTIVKTTEYPKMANKKMKETKKLMEENRKKKEEKNAYQRIDNQYRLIFEWIEFEIRQLEQ